MDKAGEGARHLAPTMPALSVHEMDLFPAAELLRVQSTPFTALQALRPLRPMLTHRAVRHHVQACLPSEATHLGCPCRSLV